MSNEKSLAPSSGHQSPFETIRRVNAARNEYWSSRDFARMLGYTNYRNFEQVIQNADPGKEIVALGQTYFAIQTRRQELSDSRPHGQHRTGRELVSNDSDR